MVRMKTKERLPRKAEDYLALPYTYRITPDPTGGYVADVEELPGCITQAETWDDIHAMIHDAMLSWISVAIEDGRSIPIPDQSAAPSGMLRLPSELYQELLRKASEQGTSVETYALARLGMHGAAYAGPHSS